jgi:hypothetical protein
VEHAKPLEEHIWLEKLVGDWTYESEASMGPDQPPMKSSGTERFRTLGGLWYVGEAQGGMPGGGGCTMIITVGYDPQKKRYVGSFIGSMMTNFWVYSGFVEENTLHLESEGPSFSGDGTMALYRDSIEFVSENHRVLRSGVQLPDGSWNIFMTSHYRRVAAE